MRFNIYGRFQVDVRRENDAWVVYRAELGKRTPLYDVIVPSALDEHDIATYLDDVFHEYARHGQQVERIAD
jgi:hypothetical protein